MLSLPVTNRSKQKSQGFGRPMAVLRKWLLQLHLRTLLRDHSCRFGGGRTLRMFDPKWNVCPFCILAKKRMAQLRFRGKGSRCPPRKSHKWPLCVSWHLNFTDVLFQVRPNKMTPRPSFRNLLRPRKPQSTNLLAATGKKWVTNMGPSISLIWDFPQV